MAAFSGTTVLLYSNGQAVALQKGLSIALDIDLPDATNKESAGWAEHICGIMNAKIDFNALFSTGLMTDAPKVLSGKDLLDYILNRTELLISILGGPFPIVGKADLSSLSLDASLENPMALTGSLKVNGPLYPLTSLPAGKYVNLITNPETGGYDYETFDVSGTAITSAINAASSAQANSNTFSVTAGDVIKFITFLTKTSGELPIVGILKSSDNSAVSNQVSLTEGLNFITLTITDTVTGIMAFINTAAANWKTSPLYLFKT